MPTKEAHTPTLSRKTSTPRARPTFPRGRTTPSSRAPPARASHPAQTARTTSLARAHQELAGPRRARGLEGPAAEKMRTPEAKVVAVEDAQPDGELAFRQANKKPSTSARRARLPTLRGAGIKSQAEALKQKGIPYIFNDEGLFHPPRSEHDRRAVAGREGRGGQEVHLHLRVGWPRQRARLRRG